MVTYFKVPPDYFLDEPKKTTKTLSQDTKTRLRFFPFSDLHEFEMNEISNVTVSVLL